MAASSIVSGILSILPGMAESFIGYEWEDEAIKKEKALGEAPQFSVPTSQIAFEEGMRKRMGSNIPGYDQMKSDIEATTSASMGASGRVSGTQAGALAGVNRSTANRRRQLRQLGAANLQHKDQTQLQYAEAVKSRTPYETAQFEYNEWLPWQIKKNEIAAIRGTGQQSMMTGLDQGAAAGIYAMNLMDQNKYYNQQMSGLYGQPTQQPAPYIPYNYGAAGQSIQQMGQNQLNPGAGTGYIEPWMKGTW